jgi:low temperature requirement protein LtrA
MAKNKYGEVKKMKKWLLVPILTLLIIMTFAFPGSASDIT